MKSVGEIGEVVLQLLALGLQLPVDFFKTMTEDGCHHMRVVHFKPLNGEKDDEGQLKRGIGAHTDYGLLVLALSEPVNSVFFQMADGEWKLLEQKEGTMTCFGGDMLQLFTKGNLLSTPHKVALNTTDRFAFAYFHEPNFRTVIKPVPELVSNDQAPVLKGLKGREKIHYGRHFTPEFMDNYGKRVTAHRIREIGSLKILEELEERAFARS